MVSNAATLASEKSSLVWKMFGGEFHRARGEVPGHLLEFGVGSERVFSYAICLMAEAAGTGPGGAQREHGKRLDSSEFHDRFLLWNCRPIEQAQRRLFLFEPITSFLTEANLLAI